MKLRIALYWAELAKKVFCPPMHIARLGAVLQKQGFEVDYILTDIPENVNFFSIEEAENCLNKDIDSAKELDPDIIFAVYYKCKFNLPYLIEFSKRFKEGNKRTKLVLLAIDSPFYKEELDKVSSFDYMLYEEELPGFFSDILNNRSDFNPFESIIPDYSQILKKKEYSSEFYIESSKGCNWNLCAFCPLKKQKKGIDKKDLGFLKKEIKAYIEIYGAKKLIFMDDNLLFDKERVIEIGSFLKDNDIRWTCFSRLDSLDKDFLHKLHDLNCEKICIGVESIIDKTLERTNKTSNIQEYIRKAKELRDITKDSPLLEIFMMFGFPWETEKDFNENLGFSLDLAKNKNILLHIENLNIIPNTTMWGDYLKGKIKLLKLPFINGYTFFDERYCHLPSIVPNSWTPLMDEEGLTKTIGLFTKLMKIKKELHQKMR